MTPTECRPPWRCETCRRWGLPEPFFGHLPDPERAPSGSKFCGAIGDSLFFWPPTDNAFTPPDFGCIHWEDGES